MGYKNVNLHLDSAVFVFHLQSTGEGDLQHQTCIETIKHLLARNWQASVTHIYRKGNRVADLLVHHEHSLCFIINAPGLLFSH
ncbi:hypothetical protein LINGRAHAP2_LOCUS28207 [Linum grandiflorum]